MAFLVPLLAPTIGTGLSFLAKKAIGEAVKLGGSALTKYGGKSILSGFLGSLLGAGGEAAEQFATKGIGLATEAIQKKFEGSTTLRDEINRRYQNDNVANFENINELKILRHLKQSHDKLENVIFGLHNKEFKDLQMLRSADEETHNKLKSINRGNNLT